MKANWRAEALFCSQVLDDLRAQRHMVARTRDDRRPHTRTVSALKQCTPPHLGIGHLHIAAMNEEGMEAPSDHSSHVALGAVSLRYSAGTSAEAHDAKGFLRRPSRFVTCFLFSKVVIG